MQPEEILVNPHTAIRLFAKTYLRIGDLVLKDRKYKVTREAWIASMFLIAISKHTKFDWWFTPVSDGSPDFNCFSFTRSEKWNGNNKSLLKLEVFEWRKEDKEDDFFEALKKIKLNKIIDPQITIVCYVRRLAIIPPAVELNKKLKELNPRVKDIWFLGDVTSDSKMWRVTQIYPNTLAVDLDYDEILSTEVEHKFMHSYRGKSDEVKYEPTGKKVYLTPEFELKLEEN